MLTIKEMVGSMTEIDEDVLVEISDKLWKIGSLEEIKKKTSPDLFYLHVGINMIGYWQNEGWWFLIGDWVDLVPYIPETLDRLNLSELKTAFEDVIKIFPDYTVFKSDDAAYCDIVNFLQSTHFKVSDERLNSIPLEKRKEMVTQIRKNLNRLEDLTESVFPGGECNGWKPILDYISVHTNQ